MRVAEPISQGRPVFLIDVSGDEPVTAVVPADGYDIRSGLGNARSDHTDAGAGDELDADARLRIDSAQIVNELREVFDAVNVVVRRRRNQRECRRGVANARDIPR